MTLVAALLREWATNLGLDPQEVDRWTALGYLHDALRGADPEDLRHHVPAAFQTLEGNVLHGPAAAQRLAALGVEDQAILDAVTFHTLGYAGFGAMGRALYAADFLEPGRSFRAKWRTGLRARMPGDLDPVVRIILAARINRLVDRSLPIRSETMAFWNSMVGEAEWVGISAR